MLKPGSVHINVKKQTNKKKSRAICLSTATSQHLNYHRIGANKGHLWWYIYDAVSLHKVLWKQVLSETLNNPLHMQTYKGIHLVFTYGMLYRLCLRAKT